MRRIRLDSDKIEVRCIILNNPWKEIASSSSNMKFVRDCLKPINIPLEGKNNVLVLSVGIILDYSLVLELTNNQI